MPIQAEGPATVVVSRRIVPGREAEFERWQRQTLKAVQRAPGYVDASIRAPGPDHPEDWVVVYRFSSTAGLDAWLTSKARQELIDRSTDLLLSPAREQRLVEPPSDSVTLVSSVRLKPGAEDEHRAMHDAAIEQARHLGGFVRAELLPAVPGAQPETVSLLTFADRPSLDRWMDSDARRDAVNGMQPLVEGERTVNVVGDFAGWFGAPNDATKRWKQAVVIWFALVPVSLVTGAIRQWFAPDLATPVAVGLSAVINIIILTWLIMPALTKALAPWLRR